jgi:hypothetical protein
MKPLHGPIAWATAALSVSLVLASCGGDEGGAGAAPPTASGASSGAAPAASPSAQPTPGTRSTQSGQAGGQQGGAPSAPSAARESARKTLTDCMARHGIVLPSDGSNWSPSPGADLAKAQAALKECLKAFPTAPPPPQQ